MSLQNPFIKSIIILSAFFISDLPAQDFIRELNSIPFSDQNGELTNIFSGGMNNIEHQFVDIEGDGDHDLIYLDSDGTYGLYINRGTAFNSLFELSLDTIPGLKILDWFYFADIDNDGDLDLFTAGQGSIIELRKNIDRNDPFFMLEIDTLKDESGAVIYSEFNSNPVFADVDADGDYDFITGNSVGTLTFYENIGSSEQFNFKFITNSWQDIFIVGGGRTENPIRHGASSLDFADMDNDGDLDLFWGDFFGRSIYYLRNDGTAEEPKINLASISYPLNQDSVYTSGFNMPRFADIDNDNDLDLFVSVLYDPTVPQSLMFYENNGDPNNPDFSKITENYLKTLDVGTKSTPAFADIDNDGDLDLFIGSEKNPNGSLHFFENIGTSASPRFLLIDSSYFNIEGELSVAPNFADIDADEDLDLFIGNFDGTISLFKNNGSKNSPNFLFDQKIKNAGGTTIDVGVFARPFLFDADIDGDYDLVSGRFNGRLSFYRNIGTNLSYSFEEDTSYFSTLDVGDLSSPFLFDYNENNSLDLFIGSRNGNISHYSSTGTTQAPHWELAADNFLTQNFGGDAAPFFADIDGDSDADIFVGNAKGGLYFYRNYSTTSVWENHNEIINDFALIEAYPNPFNPLIKLNVTISKPGEYSLYIFNSLGEKIVNLHSGYLQNGLNKFGWNGKNDSGTPVSSGNYIIALSNNYRIVSKSIMLIK